MYLDIILYDAGAGYMTLAQVEPAESGLMEPSRHPNLGLFIAL